MGAKDKSRLTIFILNVIIPIFFGVVFYFMSSPDVIFVKWSRQIWDKNLYMGINSENPVFIFARYYLLDMLWAYALVFTLWLIDDNKEGATRKNLLIAFGFSIVMEVLQLTPFVSGTFDVFDIVAEFVAEFAAFVISKNWRKENEKK